MNLSTRELLYLEDVAKLFESVNKNCSRGIQTSTDPQFKALMQSLKQDHSTWISSVSNLVTSTPLQ
jgi:hypothetical protein